MRVTHFKFRGRWGRVYFCFNLTGSEWTFWYTMYDFGADRGRGNGQEAQKM
jgi:hypothetical protein